MSDTPTDGGPAFPVPRQHFGNGITLECRAYGMTLRDYFAAAALQGQLTGDTISLAIDSHAITATEVAGSCYEWADAMLAARKENPNA